MGEPASCARVTRACEVFANGRASIKVTLEELCLPHNIVVATLSLPYCNVRFDDRARADGETLTVERLRLPRGLTAAVLHAEHHKSTWSLVEWEFEVTNAVPLTRRDEQVPFRGYWQRGEQGLTRCQVLRINATELVMSMTLPSSFQGAGETLVGIEEVPRTPDHGVGRDWVHPRRHQLAVSRGLRRNAATRRNEETVTARMTVPTPQRLNRFGIGLELPSEPLGEPYGDVPPNPRVSHDLDIAQEIYAWLVDDPKGQMLSGELAQTLQRELSVQFGESINDEVEIAGFLWHQRQCLLRPIFGTYAFSGWSTTFEYGEGVAGHTFRFEVATTYDGDRPSLIYLDNVEERRRLRSSEPPPPEARKRRPRWIICVPLRLNQAAPVIGVVSLSGTSAANSPIARELRQLTKEGDHSKSLSELEWRISHAFWWQIASSRFLTKMHQSTVLDNTIPDLNEISPDADGQQRRSVPTTRGLDGVVFSWIHLSDIHFGAGPAAHRFDQKRIVEEILRDVRHIPQMPSAVITTGDVAFSADAKEYEDAAEWYGKLAKALGVSRSCFRFVPGNHDVDRRLASDVVVRALHECSRRDPQWLDGYLIDRRASALLLAKLQRYRDFLLRHFPKHPRQDASVDWIECVPLRGVGGSLRLAGLSTVWVSDSSDSGGPAHTPASAPNLIVSKMQMYSVIKDLADDELVLLLTHHTPNWLHPAAAAHFEGFVTGKPHIHFCGHVHLAAAEQVQRFGVTGAGLRIVAGAVHGDAKEAAKHGYAWGAIRRNGSSWEVGWAPRTFVNGHGEFRADKTSYDLDADGYAWQRLDVSWSLLES